MRSQLIFIAILMCSFVVIAKPIHPTDEQLPDLWINNIGIVDRHHPAPDVYLVTLSADVYNIGEIESAPTNLTFWSRWDNKSINMTLPSIPVTLQYPTRIFWTLLFHENESGVVTVYAKADSFNKLHELNELNNDFTMSFGIGQ